MKKISRIFLLIIIALFITTGCEEDKITPQRNQNDNEFIRNGEKVDTTSMKHKHCTRDASAGTNTELVLEYDVYYTGEILNLLISHEELITNDQEILQKYETAYKQIAGHYEGLDYYEQTVTKTSNSVTNEIKINYDKIDIQKLLDIEGEEDNIIEDGKAKVDLYLALLKKFGGKCEDVA